MLLFLISIILSMNTNDKFHFENLMFCDKVSLIEYEEKYKETKDLDYLYYKCQHLIDLGKFDETTTLLNRIRDVSKSEEVSSRYLACLLKFEFFNSNFYHCKTIWKQIVDDEARFSDKWLHLEYIRFLYHFASPYVEDVLNDLLKNNPTFLPAILLKTDILASENKNKEALHYFEPYLAREPECMSIEACNSIAASLLALNDPEGAKGWIDKSLKVLEFSDTYILKGLYQEQMNSDINEIISSYKKAVDLDKYNLDAFLNLSSTLKQFKGDEELINLLEGIEITELSQQNIAIGVLASYLLFINKKQANAYLKEVKEIFTEANFIQLREYIDTYKIDIEMQLKSKNEFISILQECILSLKYK